MVIQTARKKPEEVSPRAKLGPKHGTGCGSGKYDFCLVYQPRAKVEQKKNSKIEQIILISDRRPVI